MEGRPSLKEDMGAQAIMFNYFSAYEHQTWNSSPADGKSVL